jgi:hypothetical protein
MRGRRADSRIRPWFLLGVSSVLIIAGMSALQHRYVAAGVLVACVLVGIALRAWHPQTTGGSTPGSLLHGARRSSLDQLDTKFARYLPIVWGAIGLTFIIGGVAAGAPRFIGIGLLAIVFGGYTKMKSRPQRRP